MTPAFQGKLIQIGHYLQNKICCSVFITSMPLISNHTGPRRSKPHHKLHHLRLLLIPIFTGILFLAAIHSNHGSQSFSFNSAGCVNATGFESCWSTVTKAVTSCRLDYCPGGGVNECSDLFTCPSNSSSCTDQCMCNMYSSYINCALEHCWNEVGNFWNIIENFQAWHAAHVEVYNP
jgi:hypothetical protein